MNTASTPDLDAEYRQIREESGLLNRSGRFSLTVSGPEAAEFLQGQVTNDVEDLAAGTGCYAALLDRKGKIRADMRVLRVASDSYQIDTEPEAGATVLKHLAMYRVGRDADVAPDDGGTALLSLLGPRSEELAVGGPLRPEHAHREVTVGGMRCRAIATDLGVDLLVGASEVDAVRETLQGAGAAPIGVEAAEIARVESGRPRLGREMMMEATMPQEAGINERAVSFSKGCYIGQETVARLHYKGKPNRHLRLLVPDHPVAGGDAVSIAGKEVGRIGTAVISPARGPLALAILRREAAPGAEVIVGEGTVAKVAEIPTNAA